MAFVWAGGTKGARHWWSDLLGELTFLADRVTDLRDQATERTDGLKGKAQGRRITGARRPGDDWEKWVATTS